MRVSDPTGFTNVSFFLIIQGLRIEKLRLRCYQKPRAKNQSQVLPVEEIVFNFIEECEIPLMKVYSDIDAEEDMPSAAPSRNYILMKL